MEPIRYKARIIKEQSVIDDFLTQERVGILGLIGKDYPYTVPVNYIWDQGSIYFHGMGTGKKNELLKENPKVSFLVYKEIGTVTDPVPCHADTSYQSVMIFGKVEELADVHEKTIRLQHLVEKFLPGFYNKVLKPEFVGKYHSSMDGHGVAVFRIIPEEISGKENRVQAKDLF